MGSRSRWRRAVTRGAGGLAILLALVVPAAGQGFEVPSADDPEPGQVLNVGVHPLASEEPTIVTDKVPLLEVFTATWCPPCEPAHGAVERLMAEESPALGLNASDETVGLGLLSYHPFPDVGGEDPFGIPEGHNRLDKKHDVFWFPSAYVDGVLEDAPQTRSVAVDVAMEETLYNSYKGLIDSAKENDPPFVLRLESRLVAQDPVTWEVDVAVEATRPIETPLVMQGVLWEDHVEFPGSNGVDRHRMVVRSMAPPEKAPATLAAGETWQQTLRMVAPAAVDPDRAGVNVIVEAEWGADRDTRAGLFVTFAAFVAGGTAITAAWQLNGKKRRRPRRSDRTEDTKGGSE